MSSCLKLGIHEFIGLVCVWGGCLVSALAQSEAEDAAAVAGMASARAAQSTAVREVGRVSSHRHSFSLMDAANHVQQQSGHVLILLGICGEMIC